MTVNGGIGFTFTTDQLGLALVEITATGTYTVRLKRPGYSSLAQTIQINQFEDTFKLLVFSPRLPAGKYFSH